jgi:hypothetical protein
MAKASRVVEVSDLHRTEAFMSHSDPATASWAAKPAGPSARNDIDVELRPLVPVPDRVRQHRVVVPVRWGDQVDARAAPVVSEAGGVLQPPERQVGPTVELLACHNRPQRVKPKVFLGVLSGDKLRYVRITHVVE